MYTTPLSTTHILHFDFVHLSARGLPDRHACNTSASGRDVSSVTQAAQSPAPSLPSLTLLQFLMVDLSRAGSKDSFVSPKSNGAYLVQ
jgi:hypothetical protein